ncbi:TPA: hypothetical protein L3261_002220 [Elizabethkingia anophelis]|nr:hypothetical protein [Elizabethkingia anophelis]MCT4063707.1 hypothetical protein [Elizabethkingia anophelis]MCT4109943.1 hypothetical protein [Elizabethkingia anophelis]HBN6702940.1 hypothetical protein [Elizabethkingia anophelis]HBN6706751.1 hypothetical protein [Elizabethkingia anophelis]
MGREFEGLELVPFEFLMMSNSAIEPAIPLAEASIREIPIEPVTIIASRSTPPSQMGFFERIGNAINKGWDAITGNNKAEPIQTMDKVTESVKPESVAETAKPRNGPEETGIPESSKIDGKDAAGKTTKYTEYGKDGNWTKQVEGNRGVPRHGVEGATKKVPTTNTNPKTGETFQGKPKIEPATPEETPPGNNIRTN